MIHHGLKTRITKERAGMIGTISRRWGSPQLRWLTRRRLLAGIAAVAVATASATIGYQRYAAVQNTVAPLQTAAVKMGNVRAAVTGTGTVKSFQTANLSFPSSGKVE